MVPLAILADAAHADANERVARAADTSPATNQDGAANVADDATTTATRLLARRQLVLQRLRLRLWRRLMLLLLRQPQ